MFYRYLSIPLLLLFSAFAGRAALAETIVVSDAGGGTDGHGALFSVDSTTGQRMLISDFGRPEQGLLAEDALDVVIGPSDRYFVLEFDLGGFIFAVDAVTGQRSVVSNFADPSQGPVGFPTSIALESGGGLLAFAGLQRLLLRIDPTTGDRTLLSDFSDPGLGPTTVSPGLIASRTDTFLWVTDLDAGTNEAGALIRVDPATGQRVLVSDFGDLTQGPGTADVGGVAVQTDGQILVLGSDYQIDNPVSGRLFRVDPVTGDRIVLHDFDPALNETCSPSATIIQPLRIAIAGPDEAVVTVVDIASDLPNGVYRIDLKSGAQSVLSCFAEPTQGPMGLLPVGIDSFPMDVIFADGFETGDTSAW